MTHKRIFLANTAVHKVGIGYFFIATQIAMLPSQMDQFGQSGQ